MSRVRDLRRSLSITQEELARRCGLDRTHLAKVETGRNRGGSFAIRSALARGFGCSVDDIAELLDTLTPIESLRERCTALPEAAPPPEAA